MPYKKADKNLLIFAGLGVISIAGVAIITAILFPSYKAISPVLETVRSGSIDGYQTRMIPAEAMLPTLEIGDRILIDRYAYKNASPKRGDIVLFYPTKALREQNYTAPFIKRVIGLPGETIEIKNGKVYINGEAIVEEYIFAQPEYTTSIEKIPPRSYYVLGDNRNNSHDSHYWGYVAEHLILGRAISIYFPLSRAKNFISK